MFLNKNVPKNKAQLQYIFPGPAQGKVPARSGQFSFFRSSATSFSFDILQQFFLCLPYCITKHVPGQTILTNPAQNADLPASNAHCYPCAAKNAAGSRGKILRCTAALRIPVFFCFLYFTPVPAAFPHSQALRSERRSPLPPSAPPPSDRRARYGCCCPSGPCRTGTSRRLRSS